jgi:hypothetical protein
MLLADELIERSRPHSRRQRLGLLQIRFVDVVKEIDDVLLSNSSDGMIKSTNRRFHLLNL